MYVVDGSTLAVTSLGGSSGEGVSIDLKTDRYWAALRGSASAIARNGSNNSTAATVSLSCDPIETGFDATARRVWVAAQCGVFNDPIFSINADSFAVATGPDGTGSDIDPTNPMVVNPVTGRVYFQVGLGCERAEIVSTTAVISSCAFGFVQAVNPVLDRLYAISGSGVQIINGATDPETVLKTVVPGFTPGAIAANTALNNIYVTNPSGDTVAILDGRSGTTLQTVPLGTGNSPNASLAVDSARNLVYVLINFDAGSAAASTMLFVIQDLSMTRKTRVAGSSAGP